MPKAKTASLVAKIIGAVYILALSLLKGVGIVDGLSAQDIIITGVALAGVFVSVDFNLMLEKITGMNKDK